MAEVGQVSDHQKRVAERVLSKEKPGKTNQQECCRDIQPLEQPGNFDQTTDPVKVRHDGFGNVRQYHVGTMQNTKNDKVPVRAMPESDKQKSDKQVKVDPPVYYSAMIFEWQ